MDIPPELTKPDLSALNAKDTIPPNINSSAISYLGEFSSTFLTFPTSLIRVLQQDGTTVPSL